MPSTSPVLHSLIFSSLILHHLLLGLRFRLVIDVRLVSLVAEVFVSEDDVGEDVADERCSEVGTLDSVDFADRAIERRLLVSGSRGADVGPGALAVVALAVDADPEEETERTLPFVNSPDGLTFV